MRVLAITKIFPNSLEPLSSPFNRQQFTALARRCRFSVLEAIPSFPPARYFGRPTRAARLSALPAREVVLGINVEYMRQWYLPKVGLSLAAPLYLASLWRHVPVARQADVLLGAWAYPDGVATIWLGRRLGIPVVVKVHGSDINVLGERPTPRAYLSRVLPLADALVAPSAALARSLCRLGVPEERIHIVRNGVDTSIFHPRDRGTTRRALGVPEDAELVVFVGRLEPQKGVRELLGAFGTLSALRPRLRLALLGGGVELAAVQQRAAFTGGRMHVPGPLPMSEVAAWMAAADVVTLPSYAEGSPNVVLEALASGRPVVATHVGGIPEAIQGEDLGILVPAREEEPLRVALSAALDKTWDEKRLVAASPGSWDESAQRLYAILEEVYVRFNQGKNRANNTPAAVPEGPMSAEPATTI